MLEPNHTEERETHVRSHALRKPRSALSAPLSVGLGSLLFVLFLTSAIGYATGDVKYMYVGIAMAAAAAPLVVSASRGWDLFEPISLVGFALSWATAARAVYLVAGGSRAPLLMMGQTWSEVIGYAFLSLCGVIFLCLGYMSCKSRLPIEKIVPVNLPVHNGRVYLLAVLTLSLGIIGAAVFISRNGIDLSGGILGLSVKRSNIIIDDNGVISYAVGIERYVAAFSQYGFLLLAGAGLCSRGSRGAIFGILLLSLFIVTCIVPFLASSRSTIIVPIINFCIIAYYFKKLKMKYVMIGLVFAAIVIVGMGNIRSINQTGSAAQGGVLDAVLGAGNGIDLVRTSGIMGRSDALELRLHGSSYAALAVAPVPRALWTGKPDVALGPWVKQVLYGQPVRNNGWPSGMIAEAYLNFGFIGVPLVMYLFGWLLAFLYKTVRPWLGVSFLVTVVYGSAIWRLAFGTIGLNFAQGVMQTLEFAVPMTLLALLALRWPARGFRPQFGFRAGRQSHVHHTRFG